MAGSGGRGASGRPGVWGGRRAGTALGAGLLLAALALSGCSSAGSSSGSSAARAEGGRAAVAPQAASGAAGGAGAGTGTAGTGGSGSGTSTGSTALPAGRALIYTGELQLRTTGLDAVVTRAEQLATGSGGYVDSEETGPLAELPLGYTPDADGTDGTGSTDSSLPVQSLPEPSAVGPQAAQLVLRIPTAAYDTVYQRLLGMGVVLGQERSSQDVTEQVVDIASRLKTQQASVDRVRALMDQAQSINDVITLEAALTQRESDLESLEAQQQALQSQVAMSTVTVQVFEQAPAAPAAAAPRHHNVGTAALDALKDGWHGLYLTFRALLVALAALLPFALVLLPLGWLLLRLTRWYRRSRRAAARAVLPGPPQE